MPAPNKADRSYSFELGSLTKWVLLSGVVGVAGGLAAWIFKGMIVLARRWLFQAPSGVGGEGLDPSRTGWIWVLLIPTLGGGVVGWLIYKYAPEAEGHGTDSVVRAFHRMKGVVRRRVIALKALASAITIGTGGSAGQEGPVAQVGAGVGSGIAQALGFSDRDRRLFLLSGASAGLGAMFCSPLGGALFMPEVLYRREEFEGEALVPCIIASIFAFATFTGLTGAHQAVPISAEISSHLHFNGMLELGLYAILGVLCAGLGWLYVKVFYGVETLFGKLDIPKPFKPAIGGFLVGMTGIAIAPLVGGSGVFFGGYGLMQDAFAGKIAIGALSVLILAKILATSLTISSGGSGGVFAPALSIGALIGSGVGLGAMELFPDLVQHPAPFALVGMGGFFAGVAKVPVASVIMVSEMTGGYDLLAPLMLVAAVHLLLSRGWTMYRAQVGGPIDSPAHLGDFVIDVLQSVKVSDVLDEVRPPRLIHEDVTLHGAMKIVAASHETHFPVVDDENNLVGIFSLTDLRRIFLEDGVGDFIIVRDFMKEQVTTVKLDDSLHDVQRIMTRRGVSAVPVVDSEDKRKVVALLERNAIGRAYGEELRRMREGG
jgi:chloride channel protein, CIC family